MYELLFNFTRRCSSTLKGWESLQYILVGALRYREPCVWPLQKSPPGFYVKERNFLRIKRKRALKLGDTFSKDAKNCFGNNKTQTHCNTNT